MKKFYKPLMAALMLTAALGASAENKDNTTGTTDNYSWEYWNDVHDDGAYFPNWKFTYTPALDETPANMAVNYVLKKTVGGEVVKSGEANRTWLDTSSATFYVDGGILAEGEYMMETIVTFIPAGSSEPKISNLTPVNFTVAAAPTNLPAAKLSYEVVNGPEKAYFNYSIELENIDEANVTAYRVWLDMPGNVTIGQDNKKEGSIEVDVTAGDVQAWFKGQVTYTDENNEEKTINTAPNDKDVIFKKVSDPSVVLPVLTITPGTPKALSATTGEIPFTITTDKPELEGVTYHVFCVTNNDKPVGDMTTSDLTGTLQLTDLNEATSTELWIKVEGIVGADKTEIAQYPGEAQGWTGLAIDTSEFADPNTPVMPAITLVALNPVRTGEDTGTLQYEVTLSSNEFFKSLSIKCVTNAFKVNDNDPDVVLAEIAETTELTGTLNLEGLKPNAVNGLWVKAIVTLTDDKTSEELVFPGAAQGWTGLEIDMTTNAISEVETDDAPVEYFNLQGVRVENPVNGLYIRRQGSKATKVVIR